MVDEENPQDKSKELLAKMQAVLSEASGQDQKPFLSTVSTKPMDNVSKPDPEVLKKGIVAFKTGTFLDNLFPDTEVPELLRGIPKVSQIGVVGLPDSGKSLLAKELALRLANEGTKVMLVLSEDAWKTENERNDVQARFRDTADKLKLDWTKIKENLFVLDTVTKAQLRDWGTLIETYRALVETQKATVLVMDSITLIEDYRGAIKSRLLELVRYNQVHGVTSFMISQRSTEEADQFGMAGGIGLGHIFDIVLALDYKKLSSWDAQMKMDMGAKQGENVRFARVLKCRLCGFDGHYIRVGITKEGLVRKYTNENEMTGPQLADK
jgi:KaiC/GvpD/RAD55 family RecA-like ATPase